MMTTIGISPVVSIKDIEGCIHKLEVLRGPVKDAENVYMNPEDFWKAMDAIKESPNKSYPIPGIEIISDECINKGFFYLFKRGDFELYKYLKKHPFLTDDKMIGAVMNLIEKGIIDNPLTNTKPSEK